MEYNRKVTPLLGEGGAAGKPGDERTMAFGTVTIAEGSGADQKVRAGAGAGRLATCTADWSWASSSMILGDPPACLQQSCAALRRPPSGATLCSSVPACR